MTKVLVVYASRHGATREIAQRIGDVLRTEGLEVDVAPADHAAGVGAADAVVVGSAVYMGTWLKDAVEFVKRNEVRLAEVPVWFFSSGPLPGSSSKGSDVAPVTNALGPEDGPGSGGRKKIIELSADPEKTKTLGENAKKKVRARHDSEVAAPAVTELIEKYFGN